MENLHKTHEISSSTGWKDGVSLGKPGPLPMDYDHFPIQIAMCICGYPLFIDKPISKNPADSGFSNGPVEIVDFPDFPIKNGDFP